MEMAATATQTCPCTSSSYIFFTQPQKSHIHFPFHPPSPSLLRRRLSSSAARDSSSRKRRKWDSNAETIRAKVFRFNTQENDDVEGDGEDDDYDDEMASSGIIDSIWIFKVFKSYGWALPPILLSLLFATGPKAFLMALAFPLGQSAITLAFEMISRKSRSKHKRKARVRKAKRYASRRTVTNVEREEEVHKVPKNRKGMKGYQSWVVDDDDSLNERDQSTSSFGGWDELDGTGYTKTSSTLENGPKRTIKVKDKLSMEQSKSNEPFLLRLLLAVFPFLSSWTKLFW
ncbi:uncharacterized protein LOC120208296 [Hibiscus syriacus]|uniref:uncharacterized protein LOC120208296 n=1 Tax=Hibiscus syriacus TaxID=106335 RepID=UPI001922BA9D|nr:uncharacterized protein LOC120208296 [Hibiscus syriacus]